MSLILLPGAYYVQKDLEARSARQQHQQLTLEKVQTKNRILENAVQERTRALHFALVSVERSQKALEHQLYIQSRLLASFNHDIKEPIKFSVIVSQKIAQLALVNVGQTPIQQYAKELSSSLENWNCNLLLEEFARQYLFPSSWGIFHSPDPLEPIFN